jgi:Ran GTPase-activating protein (RanGAP) involved in mRNA processing and transport
MMLRFLALEDNRLTAGTAEDLARIIAETHLEVLLLASNDLQDEGIEAIADAIALQGNHSDSQMCGYAKKTRLKRLDVSRNRVGASGLIALLNSLRCNRTLKILEAGGNEKIGPGVVDSGDCAASLASGLVAAKGLEQIHLWKCGLGDGACSLIAESLPAQISVVNLATNPLSCSLRKFITELPRGVIRI